MADDFVKANNKFSEQRAKESILRLSLVPFFGKLRVGTINGHHIEQYKAQHPDRYDPGINRTYAEMAAHYGTAILAARPRRPKDKAGLLAARPRRE